jgi:hypothetical protein
VQARIASERAWLERQLVEEYQASGKRGAAWDAAVIEALEATVSAWSADPERAGNETEKTWQSASRAVQAGCNDALVLSLRASTGGKATALEAPTAARLTSAAADALDRTRYHVWLRARAHARAAAALIAVAKTDTENQAELVADAAANLDAVKTLFPQLAKARDVPQGFALDVVSSYLDARRLLGHDRKLEFEALETVFKQACEPRDPLLPLLRAQFFIDYAWDARGGARANKVNDSAWPALAARAEQAEREVQRLITLDPGSRSLAPLMLELELTQGRGRERMEAWFRYGVTVDPGNFELWTAKLHYLEPRWYGDAAAMLEFGREAFATQRWGPRLPFVLVLAHFGLAQDTGDPEGYFAKDREACREACRDLRSVYTAFLDKMPDSPYERSAWALYAYRCGDYAEADRQFRLLGDDGRIGPFLTRAAYEHTRSEATIRAKARKHK